MFQKQPGSVGLRVQTPEVEERPARIPPPIFVPPRWEKQATGPSVVGVGGVATTFSVIPGHVKHQEAHNGDHSGSSLGFNGQGERRARQAEERKRIESGLV